MARELRSHITIAVQIVQTAIKGNSIDMLYTQWSDNAMVIAQIYHKYNNRIKFNKMNKMMKDHLKTTLTEAVAIISGKCEESTIAGELAQQHIFMMADYIKSKF